MLISVPSMDHVRTRVDLGTNVSSHDVASFKFAFHFPNISLALRLSLSRHIFFYPTNHHVMSEACCTCAALLSSIPPTYDEKTEKPSQYERRLDCCGRAICARCLTDNPRFAHYCPFCQIATGPSALPAQGLREPPTYDSPQDKHDDELPPYSAHTPQRPLSEKSNADAAPDVLHFVDPNNDSIASLSLRYGVPADALRRTNKMYMDNLLAARRTVLIPGEFYKGGVSLSPRPLEGEEEEIKKTKLRKFMVACKVSEYAHHVAVNGGEC